MLLPLLELDPGDFWGAHAEPVVGALLDEARSEVARVVEAKLSAARARLAALTRAVPAEQVAGLLIALSSRVAWGGDYSAQQTCPVCEQEGWLHCAIERGEVQFWEDEPGGSVTQTAYPFEFECPVCQLDLVDEELAEFEFPESLELDDVEATPDELWEPDEDEFRDR